MKITKSVPVFLMLSLVGNSLWASDPRPVPLDSLTQFLKKNHSSKSARIADKAQEALKKKKYAQVEKWATELERSSDFQDYGYWFAAAANQGEADDFLAGKKYAQAADRSGRSIRALRTIEERFPYSGLLKDLSREIATAEVVTGDAQALQKKWRRSLESFESGFQILNASNLLAQIAPPTLDHFGQACTKKPDDLCRSWIRRFFYLHSRVSQEGQAIAQFTDGLGDLLKPTPVFPRLTQSYHAPDLDQAALDLAMNACLSGKYGDAVKSFRQFLDDYPKSSLRFRARYWLSESLRRDGKTGDAKTQQESLEQDSPLSYYGMLAAIGTGKNPTALPLRSDTKNDTPSAVDRDRALSPAEVYHLERAEKLLAEDAVEVAGDELRDFRARDVLSSEFLAYLAAIESRAKNYNQSFQILSELIQRGYPGVYSSYTLNLIFPVEYLDLIRKYSEKNSLDPILVLSLIKQESSFETQAHSGPGAQGLMQLMPSTALEVDTTVSRHDLLDAELNLKVGTTYLRRLLNRFNGNIAVALAGYNAGPNAADRWLKASPEKYGVTEFVESIPYRETRDYVAAIIRNYFWYSSRLTNTPPKTLGYFWSFFGPPPVTPQISAVPSPSVSVSPVPSPSASLSPTPSSAPAVAEPSEESAE